MQSSKKTICLVVQKVSYIIIKNKSGNRKIDIDMQMIKTTTEDVVELKLKKRQARHMILKV